MLQMIQRLLQGDQGQRQSQFEVPGDSVNLDAKTKRTITICNLFFNHRLEMSDIARLLDEDQANVVSTLLHRGVIKERRQRQRRPPKGVERRNFSPTSQSPAIAASSVPTDL